MTDKLADIVGHEFRDPSLVTVALTHRSAASRGGPTYERLEFLGDRVLALVIAELLYDNYPDEEEGALAKRLVALVRRETLADVAAKLEIAPLIRLSRGEEEAGGRDNPAILADVCESLIGAMYLDGGLKPVAAFIRRHWTGLMEATAEPPKDAKTSLQEWAQGRGFALPAYRQLSRVGPDHAPIFTIEVRVGDYPPESGEGPTKRAAEQEAAEKLLAKLEKLENANG